MEDIDWASVVEDEKKIINNELQRKRARQGSRSDKDDKQRPCKKAFELETDPSILERRQKQIDLGKNTIGYYNYIKQVPIDERPWNGLKTPDKYRKYSRRSWDALIKIWRKKLHEYDDNCDKDDDNCDKDDDNCDKDDNNE